MVSDARVQVMPEIATHERHRRWRQPREVTLPMSANAGCRVRRLMTKIIEGTSPERTDKIISRHQQAYRRESATGVVRP